MSEKFKDRKEQRKVTETMNALLLPTLSYLTSDTANIVRRALYLLGEIEIESQESEADFPQTKDIEPTVKGFVDTMDILDRICKESKE